MIQNYTKEGKMDKVIDLFKTQWNEKKYYILASIALGIFPKIIVLLAQYFN